jgi:hypothetical protein
MYASDLGLPPGAWPQHIDGVGTRDRMMFDGEGDVQYGTYVDGDGTETVVFND